MRETRQFCTFYVAGLYFGLDVLRVQEIIRSQEITRVPLAPVVLRGLMNLRGQIVTVIDLRGRLEFEDRPASQPPINVVVESADGPVSLLVDEIGDVLEVAEADFEAAPDTLTGPVRALIQGAYKLTDRLLIILDTDRVVNLADVSP
jgi:purine-binding chemotaxis protein CheW